jgi:AAA15 family ATPase/GTPase
MQLPDFCIFAVKINSESSTGKKILEQGVVYPLLKGYKVNGKSIIYNEKEASYTPLYTNYAGQHSLLNICINAIVGENGSGKSTLVEFMLRLVNNFAASFFGEDKLHPYAERIHYIDNIDGEMYFTINRVPHILKVSGEKVSLAEFEEERRDEGSQTITFRKKTSLYYRNGKSDGGFVNAKYKKWRVRDSKMQEVADHLFYTFVSNYSIYAYNKNDFKDEWDEDGKGCWLDGIFHKNDGYQTPIVLTPYREDGNINVNKEAKLSVERLIALLLRDVGYNNVSNHLEVTGFELKAKEHGYGVKYANEECGTKYNLRGFRAIRNCICEAWQDKYNCNFDKSNNHPWQEMAMDYLASKTLKVAMKYGQYTDYFEQLCYVQKWPKEKHRKAIWDLVSVLDRDDSHITTKIRQTLGFLSTGSYKRTILPLKAAVNTTRKLLRSMKEDYKSGMPLMFGKYEDVLPPPFLNVSIKLKEDNGKEIEFDKLSSGEKQQIYSISSILYHLSNIESVHDDKNKKRVAYRRVCVILEEIELYYHPELQRQFIKYLLDGLMQMRFSDIKAISVMIVTHSPFVLSDIPTQNVLPLRNGKPAVRELLSFGANIHDLLDSNFFMEKGSKGLFAEWVIKEVVKALAIYEKGNTERSHDENVFIQNHPKQTLHKLIMTIDEPIVRSLIMKRYHEVFEQLNDDEEIRELEARLNELKSRRNRHVASGETK